MLDVVIMWCQVNIDCTSEWGLLSWDKLQVYMSTVPKATTALDLEGVLD